MPIRLTKRTSRAEKKTSPQKTKVLPGALINGRYKLNDELGRGGMGIVYHARDLQEERDVAFKVINYKLSNALTCQQFEHEAQITAGMNHPHIVKVYETGVVQNTGSRVLPFIVMELVQGKSLSDIHGFTYARVVDIGAQICESLEHAHAQGIIYRDLKPGNVILERHGFKPFVKLLDFGLARPRAEAYLDNESTLAGSFFYLAPELIEGKPADIASDLYALGATLYEMTTGRVPFSNFNEETVLYQHLEDPVPPPSHSRADVPPALEAIILRLLEKNPADRFASAKDALEALRHVLPARQIIRGNLSPVMESAKDKKGIVELRQLLEENHLVTLLNKNTSLPLSLGNKLADEFSDGVWLVDLQSITDPSLVLQSAASVLGIQQTAGRALTVTLVESLREKNLLILLQPCGHVLHASAQFAETILQTCPEVYILASSDGPLNIADEKCYGG